MDTKNFLRSTKLVFKAKKQIAPGVWTFSFTSVKPLTWKAGQHGIFFLKTASGKRSFRSFSISSAPSENIISFTTRFTTEPLSGFKQALKKLSKGDTITMRGPIGPLYMRKNSDEYAFLATGIGITPFRALLKEMSATGQKNKVTLFFAGNKDNHFFRDELSELNAKMPNLKIKYIYYPERLTGGLIEESLGENLLSTMFFISGSPKTIKGYRRTLSGLGVKRRAIKNDTFFTLKPVKPAQKKQTA